MSQKIHPDLALEAIRQLNRLATQLKWAHIGSEAYQHMRTLRACGFTNHQISTITGQRWKTSLVKKVTAKTSVTSPEISQHAISLLNQVVNANLTLPDLQIAIRINQETAGSKVQLTEILAFLQKLKDDKIELEKFFQDYSQMQQNQLTPRTLREAIKYKEDLEKSGFNLPALPKLKSLATKYGDPEKVLSAIESYGDLNIINKNLETTKHELEDAKKLLESADSQLKRHQDLEQLSKALVTNYHELQEALTNGTKNISTDLAEKLDAVAKSFENETKQKLTQFSTQYTNEINDQISQIDTTVTSLRTRFEDNATTLQAAIANGIKSANTLSEAYSALQEALQSAISKLPDDLKTDLRKAADEFHTETKHILTETAQEFKNETGKNLQNINESISNLNKQINEKSETLSTKIEDAATKATVAITNLASLATDIVSKDQNQYRKSLESIQHEAVQRLQDVKTTLDNLTKSFDERKQTLTESVNQSIQTINQNIEELSKRAVEAGEKFKEIELRYSESKPYMELLQMTKDPTTTTPHVLATLTTILDAFQRWLKTNPQTVTNPTMLSIGCDQLLTQLKHEIPDL